MILILFFSLLAFTQGHIKSVHELLELVPEVAFGQHADEKRDACELMQARGFGCQVHHVRTYQDYIIQVHRIVRQDGRVMRNQSRPVILQPGLTGSSTSFIIASETVPSSLNTTGMNMGFELARRGYDVWLSNNRGNEYGMNHTTLHPSDSRFWQWTWDEISEFDTPAILDYVLAATQSQKVAYVGHSQGTAVMFALLSRVRKYDRVVQPFIALNPITRLKGATTAFRYLIDVMKPRLWFGGSALQGNPVSEAVSSIACHRPLNQICQLVFLSTVGFDNAELNSSRLAVYMSHQPTSTSARNLLHFDQMFSQGRFARYDLGMLENLLVYGSTTSPEYDLTNITHPSMHIFYGRNDLYIPLSSITALEKDIGGVVRELHPISNPRANHIDTLIGIHIAPEVIDRVLHILPLYLS